MPCTEGVARPEGVARGVDERAVPDGPAAELGPGFGPAASISDESENTEVKVAAGVTVGAPVVRGALAAPFCGATDEPLACACFA